ncbi:hypothetical protein WQQ_29930 [Hydrocarboniphaga effusa AP103]|uniref:Uncharacterized protein n=1 Tax=Hydrocarboniphaga effusa AP103 TaxID=1172194 RepID=I8I0A9_9GAMM|nr:hypothetical protein WQQ_29930 [Hydrocarboniphaga effusa AP103]
MARCRPRKAYRCRPYGQPARSGRPPPLPAGSRHRPSSQTPATASSRHACALSPIGHRPKKSVRDGAVAP